MTKMLSQLLGAKEPEFRLGIKQLERASGGPSEDIRLTCDIMQKHRDALRELGLDPSDTTGVELYAALLQRIKQDNEAFGQLLATSQPPANPAINSVFSVGHAVANLVKSIDTPKQVFGLKTTAIKRILRAHPPKKAMKLLGFRSVESVLKREPAGLLFAAAMVAESPQWHKSILTEYKKLLPKDFELRDVQLLSPDTPRWAALSRAYVKHYKHNVLVFRELGAIVLLPIPISEVAAETGVTWQVRAAPLAMTVLVFQAINDIRASSAYLKLHQVRPDFGAIVASVAKSEPQTKAEIAGAFLPWKLVHQYFSRHPEAYNPDIFAPHVQPEDLQWQTAEQALANLHPRFAFWQNLAYVGHLGQTSRSNTFERNKIVSLNLTDSVLNFCNMLPFEQRIVRYARQTLRHELLLRYMRQSGIERTMHQQLGYELVDTAA